MNKMSLKFFIYLKQRNFNHLEIIFLLTYNVTNLVSFRKDIILLLKCQASL